MPTIDERIEAARKLEGYTPGPWEALADIARQKKTTELETEYDVECADFEGGYDMCIDVALAAHPRRFLLHHTAEGRIGICAEDDLHPPVGTQIIASLTFEEATALMDDMDETLTGCLRRDGVVEDEE